MFVYSQFVFKFWSAVHISVSSIFTDSLDHVCTNKQLFSESRQLKLGNISGISPSAVTSPASVALGLKVTDVVMFATVVTSSVLQANKVDFHIRYVHLVQFIIYGITNAQLIL